MSRLQCVIKLIGLLDKSAKIIIFGERIKQADILYEKLDRLYPNQAARCHSAMDPSARKLALERFRDGEVRILISCRALDEGFDVPSASVGIVMSSASVNRQRIQRLGRILRRHEGKELASLYYIYIAESSEESSYFPAESQTSAVCELSYHWEMIRFHTLPTKGGSELPCSDSGGRNRTSRFCPRQQAVLNAASPGRTGSWAGNTVL